MNASDLLLKDWATDSIVADKNRIAELEAALRKVHGLIIAASDETDPVEINGRLVEMAEAIRAVTNNRT